MSAPAELVIEVTAEDIANGVPAYVCGCPIALAAARALGGVQAPLLKVEEDAPGTLQISLYDADAMGNPCAVYPLPDDAAAFVRRFDDELSVFPFTFTARLEATP